MTARSLVNRLLEMDEVELHPEPLDVLNAIPFLKSINVRRRMYHGTHYLEELSVSVVDVERAISFLRENKAKKSTNVFYTNIQYWSKSRHKESKIISIFRLVNFNVLEQLQIFKSVPRMRL